MKKLLLCLALTGCAAVGPDYQKPVPVAPVELPDPALRGDNGQAYAHFSDPVLKTLQERALAASFDIRSAALHFAQSRVQRSVAGSEQGPQIGARAGATRQRTSENGSSTRLLNVIAPANREQLVDTLSDPFSVYSAGFDASWELDLWGRVRRSVEAADANMAEASSVLRDVQLAVAVEVARNYYELRAAQRQEALLRADIGAAGELEELVAMRYRGGLASELEVERQRGMLADLRSRLPSLLEQEAQAINRLTLLTGAAPGSMKNELGAPGGTAPDAPFGHAPDLALGVTSDIVARRPDIQSAEARLHAATARIGVAKADLYPRITLGASLGLESLTGSKFGDWGSHQWSIGPSLSLPLFDNGRRRATVELRELEQQQAAVAYQQTVLRAWHEVDDALTGYTAERQRQQQLKAREDSSRNTLQLSTTRYRQGLSDALPVLDAQRALIAVQRERIQGEAALTQKMLAICKAAGLTPQS